MFNSLVILSAGISIKFPEISHPEAVIGYLCFTLLGLTLTALKQTKLCVCSINIV